MTEAFRLVNDYDLPDHDEFQTLFWKALKILEYQDPNWCQKGHVLGVWVEHARIPSPVLSFIGYSGKETYLANPLSLLQSLRILNRGRNLLDMLESPETKIQQGLLQKGTPPCAVP